MVKLDSLKNIGGTLRATLEADKLAHLALEGQPHLTNIMEVTQSIEDLLGSPCTKALSMIEAQTSSMQHVLDSIDNLDSLKNLGSAAQAALETQKAMRITPNDLSIAGTLGGSAAESLSMHLIKNPAIAGTKDIFDRMNLSDLEATFAIAGRTIPDSVLAFQKSLDSEPTIYGPTHFELPPLPSFHPNPIHGTNYRLERLSDNSARTNQLLSDASAEEKKYRQETRHWLDGYPDAQSLYNNALEKYEHGVYFRNLLDDLRLALERLLCAVLSNSKSLENQISLVGIYIKDRGGSQELANMFVKLIDYYGKYQNNYVKHNDAVIETEIEFILEITSSFMKHLIRLGSAE